MHPLPEIRTARLLLTPFSIEDTRELHLLWQDPEVRRFLWDDRQITFEQAKQTVEAALRLAESEGIGMWSIRFIESEERQIGFCGFRYISGTTGVELLYALLPAYWKRGFATEAARAIIRYLFQTTQVSCVFAGCDPGNESSFAVMQRLGMRPVPDGTIPIQGVTYCSLESSEFEKQLKQ